jgi:hypothetical protein
VGGWVGGCSVSDSKHVQSAGCCRLAATPLRWQPWRGGNHVRGPMPWTQFMQSLNQAPASWEPDMCAANPPEMPQGSLTHLYVAPVGRAHLRHHARGIHSARHHAARDAQLAAYVGACDDVIAAVEAPLDGPGLGGQQGPQKARLLHLRGAKEQHGQ